MTSKKAALRKIEGLVNYYVGRGQGKLQEEEKLVPGFEV